MGMNSDKIGLERKKETAEEVQAYKKKVLKSISDKRVIS